MRSTHASHLGPTCPKCPIPLVEHFIRAPKSSDRRAAVRNRMGKACFEVGVQ